MLYQRGTWTCPASHNTSQETWDLATLSKDEYISKYSVTEEEYKNLVEGK